MLTQILTLIRIAVLEILVLIVNFPLPGKLTCGEPRWFPDGLAGGEWMRAAGWR